MLLLATASPAFAQNARPVGPASTGLRPLAAREGWEIARATTWRESAARRTEDCSHLVHDRYEKAGYPYPYANSLDLYNNGSESFVRVRTPQPGDLIVWPGHVGIVVDPKEHSFFSSTNSGARTAYYNSPYWRARGSARFYRYLTDKPARSGAAAKIASAAQQPTAPAGGGRRAKYRPAIQPVKTAPAAGATARSAADPASASRAELAPGKVLRIPGKQPQAADVAGALADRNQAAGEILRAGNLEQLGRTVIVYRELRVTNVEIKAKRGAAQVEIESLAVLSGERMDAQRGWEVLRPELQRTKKGWVVAAANENVYVPRDAAMRVLAARLAELTQNADPSSGREGEQAQIIRFLNLLVAED